MSASAIAVRPPAANLVLWIVALLALAIVINYVDRGALSTAAPLMKRELRLNNTQVGILISAFFWTYTPGQVLSGWLAERINPYRTLTIGLLLWSLATIATGLAGSFTAIVLLRLVLGTGESANHPCGAKLMALHLPTHRLGMANGLISAGQSLGQSFGVFAGGLMMASLGWRR